MQTKEITIPKEMMEKEWQTNKVKIKKWNLALRNQIMDESSEMTAQKGKQFTAKVKGGQSQIMTIVKCVIEAPWNIGGVNIVGELDPDFGDWLYGEICEFNGGGSENPPVSEESSAEK